MNRPYVICHILSSLDSKINGAFMAEETTRELAKEYGNFRAEMNADAWLYGTTTTKEFTDFRRPVLEDAGEVPEGDYVADSGAELYFVSLDVDGEIGWESGTFCNKGREPAHVIEILTGVTPLSYRAYLRAHGVSYVIAGEKELDGKAAMEKLYELFHIEKLLICGGGVVNYTFLQAGMVDELSLFVAPMTDGGSGNASLFSRFSDAQKAETVEFELKDVKRIGRGGVHLLYLAKNTKIDSDDGKSL